MRHSFVFILALFIYNNLNAQVLEPSELYTDPNSFYVLVDSTLYKNSKISCDTLYYYTDTKPIYKGGEIDLANYLMNNNDSPFSVSCIKESPELVSVMKIQLTIDNQGSVINCYIMGAYLHETCIDKIKERFFLMTGWSPGYRNNKAVCSFYNLPISCIKY